MKRALLLATLLAPLPTLAAGFEGGYVGLYSGYAWAEDEGTSYSQFNNQKTGWTQETNPMGAQIGVLGGYNWPLQHNWLVGVEADYEGRIDGADSDYQEFNGVTDTNYRNTSEIKSSGSLRGRLGYLPTPDLLLFATAGYAYASVEREWEDNQFLGRSESQTNGQAGWTVGAGAEYLLNDAFSARLEYRYADFGTQEGIDVDMWSEEYKQRLTEQSLRLGAAYHF
ncbi:porin family protein [Aquipseudomonas campi]|uniref:Porin family protein n=1 Tax=Aquipseudomonas campi TaxID=2731681 RepID=A0A6M8FN23_9GAMM|nr:outer membrane beta-barrel protein [Pseudomonas campi]QKE65229.1 porin family protein [Pseudomonas campi]